MKLRRKPPAPRMFTVVGGPLDGQQIPDLFDYFEEGDMEAIDTMSLVTPENGWSPESVYVTKGRQLVYDEAATQQRRIVAAQEARDELTFVN